MDKAAFIDKLERVGLALTGLVVLFVLAYNVDDNTGFISGRPMNALSQTAHVYGARSPQSVLSLTATILGKAQPKSARRGRVKGLRYVDVPGAKAVVPFIQDFAKNGQTLVFRVGDRTASTLTIEGQPVAAGKGLQLPVKVTSVLGDGLSLENRVVPWPESHPELRRLCLGEWTDMGQVSVKMDPSRLFPEVTQDGDDTVIQWESPPQFRVSWWFMHWTFGLRKFTITDQGGRFEVDGVSDRLLPRLVWK